MRHRIWLYITAVTLSIAVAHADPKGPDLRQGVLYGVVLDTATNKPLTGATVAALDKKGQPIAWGKTDENGRYALVAPPMRALNLEHEGRGGGLLASLCRGVGSVVGTATDITVGAVKVVAGATIGATTVGAAAAVVKPHGTSDPEDQVKAQVVQQSGTTMSNDAQRQLGLKSRHHPPASARQAKKPAPIQPGQLTLRVDLASYQPFQGASSVYWMEPPVKQQGQPEVGPQAWLEPVLLAPTGKSDKSRVAPTRILVADGKLEPQMALPGSTVKVTAKVNAPKQEGLDLRLFLIDDRGNQVTELKPAGDSRYAAEFQLAEKHPLGATVLTLAALRSRPVTVDVSRAKEDPLPRLAGKLDDLKPKEKYEYDPRVLASHNRLDLPFVVLDPKKGIVDPTAIPGDRKPDPAVAPPPPAPEPPKEKPNG